MKYNLLFPNLVSLFSFLSLFNPFFFVVWLVAKGVEMSFLKISRSILTFVLLSALVVWTYTNTTKWEKKGNKDSNPGKIKVDKEAIRDGWSNIITKSQLEAKTGSDTATNNEVSTSRDSEDSSTKTDSNNSGSSNNSDNTGSLSAEEIGGGGVEDENLIEENEEVEEKESDILEVEKEVEKEVEEEEGESSILNLSVSEQQWKTLEGRTIGDIAQMQCDSK